MSGLPGMSPEVAPTLPQGIGPGAPVRPGERPPLAAGSAASRAAPANPTVRGVAPLDGRVVRPTNPNGYAPPAGNAVPRAIDPAAKRGTDDDDVTIVSDREKSRPHVLPSTEDSIDVALSELEHEQ
jgi:hypothetical protein